MSHRKPFPFPQPENDSTFTGIKKPSRVGDLYYLVSASGVTDRFLSKLHFPKLWVQGETTRRVCLDRKGPAVSRLTWPRTRSRGGAFTSRPPCRAAGIGRSMTQRCCLQCTYQLSEIVDMGRQFLYRPIQQINTNTIFSLNRSASYMTSCAATSYIQLGNLDCVHAKGIHCTIMSMQVYFL